MVKLSDERFIVTFLDPKEPTKKAGWEFGTEILSVVRMNTILKLRGVSLDIRVPITEENEKAKLEGRDPVLEAGIAALRAGGNQRAIKRLVGRKWQWAL